MPFSLYDRQAKQQPGGTPSGVCCQAAHEDDDGGCIAAEILVTLEKRPADYWRQQVLSRE
jgi:hypothetical protein